MIETKKLEVGDTYGKKCAEEAKREDIDCNKLYLAKYHGIWLIGRFQRQWYGWNFLPNLGSMSIQYSSLDELHEIVGGLEQQKAGDIGSHVIEIVASHKGDDDE